MLATMALSLVMSVLGFNNFYNYGGTDEDDYLLNECTDCKGVAFRDCFSTSGEFVCTGYLDYNDNFG